MFIQNPSVYVPVTMLISSRSASVCAKPGANLLPEYLRTNTCSTFEDCWLALTNGTLLATGFTALLKIVFELMLSWFLRLGCLMLSSHRSRD